MLSPALTEALARLRAGEPIHGRFEEAGCELAIDPSLPYLCAAIHDGHGFAADLEPLCLLPAEERIFEEDPHTGDLVRGLPNFIVGLHSRYEYDLNRPPESAIHDVAWGREVWRSPLPDALRERSLSRHAAFYAVVSAVLEALVAQHGGCIVYDIHSYNGARQGGAEAPAFNIGTEQVDKRRYRRMVDHMVRMLSAIEIEGEPLRTSINEIFYGRGYLATVCRKTSNKVLCLPIEIRKFFCIEETGAPYPAVLTSLKAQMVQAITENASHFAGSHLRQKLTSRFDLLASSIDRKVLDIDKRLYALARNLETLLYINPINIDGERSAFFAKPGRAAPQFHYRKVSIDPYAVKEALYRLEVEQIHDTTVQALYRRAVDGLAAEVDLIASIGSRDCLYNSLRYYGEPFPVDLQNARFLLHAPDTDPPEGFQPLMEEGAIVRAIQAEVDKYHLDAPVLRSARIVAGAMVDNANFRVLVRRGLKRPKIDVDALRHHEVGIHLLTAAEARRQPLRLFRLGLPGSTETQEGLAVLAEYLSGNLTMERLKTLAMRVVAVRSLIDDYDFTRTYQLLVEEYHASPERAFLVTTRVFRGGGFTKDYLYLRGLARALNHWKSGKSFAPLTIGKSSFRDVNAIEELMARGVLPAPKLVPEPFQSPAAEDPIHAYLLSGLRYAEM